MLKVFLAHVDFLGGLPFPGSFSLLDKDVMFAGVTRLSPVLVGLSLLLVGCAGQHTRLVRALREDTNPAAHTRDLEEQYLLRSPDVLRVEIEGWPDCSGEREIDIDGRLVLVDDLAVVADGLTVSRLCRRIARKLRVAESAVSIEILEHRSQCVYLFGELGKLPPVVAYRGPETILDLLQRLRAIPPGAALDDIFVVRAHVADGRSPEVFRVDLDAILLQHDLQTNLRLEPFDRIHIGQAARWRVACHLPPWIGWLVRGDLEDDSDKSAGAKSSAAKSEP